ncbi:MAG: hypothetical protein ACXWQ5_00145 [Ktedonobacterales bacterium]
MATSLLDLGDDHVGELRTMPGETVPTALKYWHNKPDGTPCPALGYIFWHPDDKQYGWTLNSLDPLDVSPSLLCTACGDHGFIRGGKWVRA